MKWIVLNAVAALAAVVPVQAQAQEQSSGELTLYGRGHFMGPRLVLDGPASGMSLPFTVKSVKIPEGQSWELCSGNTFSGCKRFSTSNDAMAMTVRSARPAGKAVIVPGGTVSATGRFERAPPSPSLRGLASEFFVAPEKKGNRIEVSPGTPEGALAKATEYCRSVGWGGSVHGDLQTAGGRSYLVDVLCVR
jgi:hypothetical protein